MHDLPGGSRSQVVAHGIIQRQVERVGRLPVGVSAEDEPGFHGSSAEADHLFEQSFHFTGYHLPLLGLLGEVNPLGTEHKGPFQDLHCRLQRLFGGIDLGLDAAQVEAYLLGLLELGPELQHATNLVWNIGDFVEALPGDDLTLRAFNALVDPHHVGEELVGCGIEPGCHLLYSSLSP